MELITDLQSIPREIGLRLKKSSLYSKLNLDACRDVTPSRVIFWQQTGRGPKA